MGATRFELQAAGPQVATGQGGQVTVAGIKEMEVFVNVTAQSGTTPVLTVFLQSSSDGGTTWYDLPHDGVLETEATAAEGDHRSEAIATDAGTNKGGARNVIHSLAGASVPQAAFARYKNLGDLVRAAWVISGTTPSFTFSVKAIGKD